jgi:16S rRNA (adenine1518-N6/adenine1519-N6)-dimethyltransferase
MALTINYDSPVALKNFLDSKGMAMQKKFGQNFLINSQARKLLVDSLKVDENTTVWEVGPGLGCMTSEIIQRGAKLTAFEIDRGFAAVLKEIFEGNENFSIVEGDVLKTWKNYYKENGLPDRFFGNLPYNIAATLIADTIENNCRFDKCVFTIQTEVAQRMIAKPGTADYSSFSVLCQWAYDVKNIMDRGGGNFWPKPNVGSRTVLLTKKESFKILL